MAFDLHWMADPLIAALHYNCSLSYKIELAVTLVRRFKKNYQTIKLKSPSNVQLKNSLILISNFFNYYMGGHTLLLFTHIC